MFYVMLITNRSLDGNEQYEVAAGIGRRNLLYARLDNYREANNLVDRFAGSLRAGGIKKLEHIDRLYWASSTPDDDTQIWEL